MNGVDLGGIVRPYEDPRTPGRSGKYWVGRAHHRIDDDTVYMRPNADGKLQVVAACGRHYVMQSQRDLLDGVAAPCDQLSAAGVCRSGKWVL
jgi:hypothetical protein